MPRRPSALLPALVAGLVGLAACGSGGGRASPRPATTSTAPLTSSAPPTTAPAAPAGPALRPAHVMLVVLENREYDQVVGSPSAPFLAGLASRYGLATHVFARTHPSLPNYLELLAGTTFGISSDCTSCSVEGDTLADQLDRAGIPWGAYFEAMPSPCFTGASAGRYAKKHNPFVYVRHVVAEPAVCAKVQPYDRLAAALGSPDPPAFVWVTPDLCHDGHDCPLSAVDTWLRDEVTAVQASPWYRAGGTIVVTWDEGTSNAGCCGSAAGGRVATYVVADGVRAGGRLDTPVSQAGILGTVEGVYGVPRLGEARDPASGSLAPLFPH